MTQKLLLSLSDLARYLGVTRPTMYRMVQADGFPRPVPLPSDFATRWDREAVDAWRAGQTDTVADAE